MPVQEFDLIQRIRVEDGVPRLMSTKVKVIKGGDDLLSKALDLLEKMGFYEKFEEKRTSQYIGFKLKNAPKGKKRYQLILTQKQEELCVSIAQNILEDDYLSFGHWKYVEADYGVGYSWLEPCWECEEKILVLLSQQRSFLAALFPQYWELLDPDLIAKDYVGYRRVEFNRLKERWDEEGGENDYIIEKNEEVESIFSDEPFDIRKISDPETYLILEKDKLFPHTLKTCITQINILEELINYCGNLLMEKN